MSGWEQLLEEFRALGGIADNLRSGEGKLGRGIFPADPSKPVRLHCPERLLVPRQDLRFVDGALTVVPESKLSSAERDWFERYQAQWSWGVVRPQIEDFLRAMQALPDAVRVELASRFGLYICWTRWSDQLAQDFFLNSRAIACKQGPTTDEKRSVVMPLVELLNCGFQANYEFDNGIGLSGHFDGEVLVKYSGEDALGYFRNWGFVADPPIALSRQLRLKTSFGELEILREQRRGRQIDIPDLGSFWIPELTVDGQLASLSFLVIGNRNAPRLPKTFMLQLFAEAGLPDGELIFDQIRRANTLDFIDLLEVLEGVEADVAASLRAMARNQLRTMAECWGTRTEPFTCPLSGYQPPA